ncbi:unnamed protein product [Didymodactylos carnosus]|uniref:HMG box domain-containing protein n=1 Tax=Didymodactylos carnosus TaxID=1234261 RepID=A0A814BQ47_9BILA|nr:unnamed protein product [Didymodactylos carnosus]CAF0929243.1 unnamed protein product [Didymodactylos carnosus]CAF3525143.1 unnamed protein product [Didymodactylos carnosus]CAF3707418.1 unnamed protein product [Didymodactylos carnosus]
MSAYSAISSKRPLNAYFLFQQDNRDRIRDENPSVHIQSELAKITGEEWRNAPARVKERYQQRAEQDMDIYKREKSPNPSGKKATYDRDDKKPSGYKSRKTLTTPKKQNYSDGDEDEEEEELNQSQSELVEAVKQRIKQNIDDLCADLDKLGVVGTKLRKSMPNEKHEDYYETKSKS